MVAIAYRSWSFTRGFNCKALNGKNMGVLDRWSGGWTVLLWQIEISILYSGNELFNWTSAIVDVLTPKTFLNNATFSFSSYCLTLFRCHCSEKYTWFVSPTVIIQQKKKQWLIQIFQANEKNWITIWHEILFCMEIKPYPWINIRQKQ